MRAYTVAATAVTLNVSKKWVDNVLSHHQVTGVLQKKQGIVRRVTPVGLLNMAIALDLGQKLGTPIGRALEISAELTRSGSGEVILADTPLLRLTADIDTLIRTLNTRLERALEITPTPRRGRPARK